MAIQVRRGKKKDFDPDKMLPGEWAGTTDTKEVFFTFAPGDTKKMATYEDMAENIREATGEITAGLTEGVSTAIEQANAAADTANQAAETAQTSITNLTEDMASAIENSNTAAETATQAAQEAQDAAQEAREASNAVLSVNIATGTTPGIVKATEEITVAEDGSMTLNTEFTMPEEISEITSGENWKLILGKIAKLMENYMDKMTLIDLVYPVDTIYASVNPINPSQLFGGTWIAWGSGKVPVGVDTSDTNFNTVEKTGGEKTHTLTVEEMPKHSHNVICEFGANPDSNMHPGKGGYAQVAGSTSTTRISRANSISNTGSGAAHNNLQPYITCYMWKRTA